MTKRSDALQHFISSLQIAVLEGDLPDAAKPAATRIFDALAAEEGKQKPPTAKRLPVCDHLPTTFENAKAGPDRTIQLGAALSAIEPQLAWFQKPAGDVAKSRRRDVASWFLDTMVWASDFWTSILDALTRGVGTIIGYSTLAFRRRPTHGTVSA